MTIPDYRKATNAAYQLLAQKTSFSLSTNVFAIVEELLTNCKLITYSQACFLYGYTYEMLTAVSEFGFTIKDPHGRRIILYNEDAPLGCIRFTIAHEIGHAVLDHHNEDDRGAEREANCFARNLLCPSPIVYMLHLDCVDDYVSIFNVSESMATVSFDKRKSDRYYITDNLFAEIQDKLEACLLGFDGLDAFYRDLAS